MQMFMFILAYDHVTFRQFNIAIENGPFIVDLATKNGGSFHSSVKLPGDIMSFSDPSHYLLFSS